MRTRRVAALWLPGFSLQAVARDDPALRAGPAAITDGTRVLARNRRAAEAGVTVGMRVPEAATCAADLRFAPDDSRRTQALWDVVLDQLDALGPIVEDAGLGLALVDLSGAGRSEQIVLRTTLHALTAFLGLTARAAVADGPYVATVAARRAAKPVTAIPRGNSAAFLAPLPVAILPLAGDVVTGLTLLGIRTVAAFARLRISQVHGRYGVAGMAAYTLASGIDDRPLVPRVRERRETLSYPFDPPVDDTTPLLFVAKALLDNHAAILRREGMVAAGLRLTLAVEGGESVVIEQRWGAACVPGAAELDALRLVLATRLGEAKTAGETDDVSPPRITDLTVTLLDCTPDRAMQLPLFGAGVARQREAVAHLLTRLHALLGPLGVVEDVPVAAHAIEERWHSRPFDAARIGTPVATAVAESGVLPSLPGFVFRRPPDAVTVGWIGGQMASLRYGGVEGTIIARLGPYPVEGRWWEAGHFARTYWLLAIQDETLHLVAEEEATGAWTRVGVVD